MSFNRIRIILSRSYNRKNVAVVRQKTCHHFRHRQIMTAARPPVASSMYARSMIRFNHDGLKTIKPFILPDIGEGINEVVVKSWLVKVGDHVKEFDGICEVESDKATATISSRFEGQITRIHYEVGDMAKVGSPLIDIQTNQIDEIGMKQESHGSENQQELAGTNKSQFKAVPTTMHRASPSASQEPQVATLPSVRRFAKEKEIDLSLIKPTGKQGQILKEDVLSYLKHGEQQVDMTRVIGLRGQSEKQVQLSGIKRAMFKVMTQSAKIPHFYYSEKIDMTRLIELTSRLRANADLKFQDKLSNFAIIIKMVSLSLKDYPQLNASVNELGDILTEKHYHNIGVAVDTKAGLIVPNIKNVQDLTITQINSELLRLRKLGYESKLGPADLSGGTMTLSNIGAIGGEFGVPVLVSPEIVIGALGRTSRLPRFNSQGGIVERHIMQLTWSADHRVVDGATLSRFSNLLKYYLEEPGMALLDMV